MPHRRRWVQRILIASLALAIVQTSLAQADVPGHFADARLNDVCLIGQTHAWAVGDRGTILHSADGGRTWQHQMVSTPAAEDSSVDASAHELDIRLTSVHFLNDQIGWAVGGRTQPHTLASVGVVLTTIDGGQTWRELPARNLPALEQVKFFDMARGIAIGRASSMQPSGVYLTADGGRTWRSAPGGTGWAWQTGDFVDHMTGAVAGRGLWAGLDRGTLRVPDDEPPRVRALRDLVLVPPVGGWAAGDGGLVVTTPDLGRTWFQPDGLLPEVVSRHFDFRAVAVQGDGVWVAGSPGSRILHSPDAGRTWQSYPTGVAAPLSGLAFAGAGEHAHGIAVGALGTILATGDGGRSWQIARQPASRTPLLAVAGRDEALPVDVLVQSAAADGYLAATCVLLREPLGDASAPSALHAVTTRAGDDEEARMHEAVLLAGGTATGRAWRFSIPRDVPDVLAELDRLTDGRGLAQLEAFLVREIRMWRPEVIVVGASSSGPTSEDRLARALVLAAVEAAADPTRHIDLATEADLPAWRVRRVLAIAEDPSKAHVTIATTAFHSHGDGTIGELAAEVRSVLGSPAAEADAVPLEQLAPLAGHDARLRNVFDGIEIAPGSDGRRARPAVSDEQVEQAAAAAEKGRNVRAILAGSADNPALASHVTAFTEGLSGRSRARVLHQLADGYRRAGRRDLAADALERLVREQGDDPLAGAALVWLVQYHAGSETKWASVSELGSQQSEIGDQAAARPLSVAAAPAIDVEKGLNRDKPLEIARLAADLRPQLILEPQVGFPIAAIYRRAGLVKEADRYMLLLRQRGADDAWQRLAEAEQWLMAPTEHPPELPIWTCRRTTERPHLDGVLDEPFWHATRSAVLAAGEEENSQRQTDIKLAYDGEFLYLAIAAPSRRRHSLKTTEEPMPRRRDEHLNDRDRVHLAIDVDRDLTTYYELTLDDGGHVHDEAWHDPRWDPKWFVAHAAEARSWTIEAAIPFAELVGTPPAARDVWCISAAHLSPDGRPIPWHGPATPKPSPASFGLLIFE